MCGIVGIVARGASVSPEVLERATRSLAHRGPDDHGTTILHENVPEPVEVGLGNRRLAILDLSPLGHQPMLDPTSGNWIVHNGEVYNFRQVREELERHGVSFTSQSDTEVILKAYVHWGEQCVARFRGMFAFAVWDAQRHRLFVARDPMGIKPLYYFQSDRHFVFASEVRTLLVTGLLKPRLDPAGLLSYLSFGSLYDPTTLLQGISALGAGSYLIWESGKVTHTRYWDLLDESEPEVAPPGVVRDESHNCIAATLDESVRMQLVSDVPVGVFLSGGIDSSSLVGILSRAGIRPSTFSIVFREPEYSEAEHSRAVARHFATDHHEITVSQSDFFDTITPALAAMDLPTMDGINTYFVSAHARAAGVKVALSGLGGDEVFAGYSSFRTVPRMERFAHLWRHVPKAVRKSIGNGFSFLAPATDQNRKLAALASSNGHFIHSYFLSRMLFTPRQEAQLLREIRPEDLVRAKAPLLENLKHSQHLDPVNQVSYLESRCYMLNTLLRDSDSMSMAHGLEVRVPLIDHQLARQVLTLPGSWKLNGSTPKPLLTRALHGQLPRQIVHRPKRGFTLPVEQWLRAALRPDIEKSLGRIGKGPLGSVISQPAARQVWEDFLQGKTSSSRPWSLYVLQRWCEQHV